MMKLKVCGMKEADNLKELIPLRPDFVGFIFYDKSPRFVADSLDEVAIKALPRSIKKVGVFVNATMDYILKNTRRYDIPFIQLHGNETPDFCKILKRHGLNVIKAFSIDETFNFTSLNNYKPHCDYFLFDTKGQNPGGNGVAFDWSILNRYDNEKPFFLSGGLSLENIEQVAQLSALKIYAIDVNSKFEISPANKDIEKLRQLVGLIRPIEETMEV
jgi:phosphoribosylanthranilate isomerase